MPPTTRTTQTNRTAAVPGALAQATGALRVEPRAPGFSEVTDTVVRWLEEAGAEEGMLTVFVRHTSASLAIQENADPDVQSDLQDALDRLAPETAPYRHTVEGPDDMPAHVKAMVTSTSLSVPVQDGRLLLGTWQGIYLIEHRSRPRPRDIVLHYLGTFRA